MDVVGQPTRATIDVQDLGRLLHERRTAGKQTLRDVQKEMEGKLTASSLSRIENGATPDPANVPVLAKWLGIPIDRIGWPGQRTITSEGMSIPDVLEVHLRADPKLDPAAADVLARTFRRLYQDIVSGEITLRSPDEQER